MLGTLRMDIDTCIDEYIQLSPQIFPVESSVSANSFIKGFRQASGQPRFEAEPLERAIKRLVVKYLGDEATEGEDTLLRFEASRDRSSPKCKTFVCVTSMKPRRAFRFRSYHSPQDDVEDCPIWQACRATSAAPTLFPPMLIGKLKVPFADGGLGHNNPIRSLMDEAGKLWPSRDSGCIVSIGTGMPASRDLGASFPSLVKSLKEIATDTETVAREFKHEMKSKYQSEQNVYFRFNVPHGLENVGLEEWKEMGRIQTATTDYVSDESSQIAACTLRLHAPGGHFNRKHRVFSVPFEKSDEFVGRQETLRQVHHGLQTGTRRIAISGLGGLGKSATAIEYTHRFGEFYDHILWIFAANDSTFCQAYEDIAANLDIPAKKDVRIEVRDWLCDVNNGCWLMIVDNADSTDMFFSPVASTQAQLSPGVASFLPRSSNGSILFTTRSKILGAQLSDSAAPIQIRPLLPQDAVRLLSSRMKRGKGKGWCALDAEKLVDVLGHIPLAITQAAAFLSMFNMSLQQYLTTLKKDNANLRDFLSEELKCTDRESEYPNSIFLTWRASFNQIRREDPRAADLLACMAVLDRSGVFTNHLRRKTDTDLTYLKALGTLQAFDLIQASEYSGNRCPGWMPAIRIRVEEVKPPEKPIFVMHRLVRLSTQAWLESENTLSIYQMKVVHGIADKYRPPFRRLLPDESRYLGPHARTVSRYHAGSPPDRVARAKVRCILGITQILTPGSTRAFDNASRDAFKLNQRLLRADDPLAHRSFELSCERLCAFDEYEEVESMCRQNLRNLQAQGASDLKYELGVRAILARAISLQAGNSPFLLSDDHGNDHGFNSKADIAEATDKLDEAETMLQEVIRLQEQKLGITAALATRHWLMDHVLKC